MINRIKEIRIAKGISQKELASKAGVSQPFVHDLENENRGAKPETLEKIASALECTVEELYGEQEAS